MNGLEEIQECIKNFVYDKKQEQEQIAKIEEKRTELAEKRNKIKAKSEKQSDVFELANQITELGNQSQELQNKLDFKYNEVKTQINCSIDNLISDGIRKIRQINEEAQEIDEKIQTQIEKDVKYEIQKQEFFARFGRIPELSEEAKFENEKQKQETLLNKNKLQLIEAKIEEIEEKITELARIKREFKNKNWAKIIKQENEVEMLLEEDISFENMDEFFAEEATILPLVSENVEEVGEVYIDEIQPIEELQVEKFEPIIENIEIEELHVEPFELVEELQIEEFDPTEEIKVEEVIEEKTFDPIEEIAKSIVEEIAAEQTKDLNINKVEEDIIAFEEKIEETKTAIVDEKITLSNIIAKIENGEIVYKAQISNGKELKIYPARTNARNQLLRDKENREELKEILINYATSNNKNLDKKVINKIDPIVCQTLVVFANKYNYNAQNLIYNYAMSFSNIQEYDADIPLPTITYNLSYINGTYLSKKEKNVIARICKNARKNNNIDMIGNVTLLGKIKYLLKRVFAINTVNALPEGGKDK